MKILQRVSVLTMVANLKSLGFYLFEIVISFILILAINIFASDFLGAYLARYYKIISLIVFFVLSILLGEFIGLRQKRRNDYLSQLPVLILSIIVLKTGPIGIGASGFNIVSETVLPYIYFSPLIMYSMALGINISLVFIGGFFLARNIIVFLYISFRRHLIRSRRKKKFKMSRQIKN